MEFNVNHPILFILAGVAVLVVVLQSVAFLLKALKRAKELGFSSEKLKKIITSSAIFTIAPAIAIGIGIITLSGYLGLPLPWLRLSVVGSIVYELSAAETASSALGLTNLADMNAQQFATIAWTMTVGIAISVLIVPLFCKKTLTGVMKVGAKDKKWGEHFSNALFYGLIATFVGQALSGVTLSSDGVVTALVLLTSAIVMALCGALKKAFGWKWINDYALPLCMVIAMAAAIPITAWLS